MKKAFNNWIWLSFAIMGAVLFAAGCGSSGGEGGGATTTTTTTTTQTEAESNLAAIGLVASQSSINPNESTTLEAMAYNASGNGISGQELVFTVDDPTLGYVTETATTGADGTAQVTFTARSNPGTVNITAIGGGVSSLPRAITILDQTSPANIALSVNPSSINATKTATVTATVTDSGGSPVDNGTTVYFEVENSTYGTITPSAVTNTGVASATFTASSNPGTATINVSSGSATASIDITISPVAAASIEFLSVSQNPVAIRGTGGVEYSVIEFYVKDINGNPAQDVDVLFTMTGPGGSEYIEDDDATPYVQTVGTTNGIAKITLHSGDEPGPVTISASITTASGSTITANTPVISIGGGVPTDKWLTVSATKLNLGGLEYVDLETDITAWLADRFGNYNVLDGYAVSFESEIGLAIDSNNVTADKYGAATVTARTQKGTSSVGAEDVVPEDWECELIYSLSGGAYTPGGTPPAVNPAITDYSAGYGNPLPTGHPRDGVCVVMVHTKGEEHFYDGSNGCAHDGQYNTGEDFTDTADDPFRDYDDDGLWDDGTTSTSNTTYTVGANGFEDYVDAADNSVWDGVNGIWDSDKQLFRNAYFLITGPPIIRFDVSTFTVPDGGSASVNILICDENYNLLTPGSTVSITVDAGKVYGPVDFTYPNTNAYGPDAETHLSLIEFPVTIADDDPGDTDDAENCELKVEVVWKNEGHDDITRSVSIHGTVD